MKLRLVFLIALFLNVLLPTAAFSAKILIIQSYHKSFKWDQQYTKALTDMLGKEHKLFFFRMDTKRVPKSQFEKRADLAWQRFLSLKPDYVILGDDNALKYLGERFAKTKTPVVFLGVNGDPTLYFKNRVLPENITGVLERPFVAESLKTVSQLMPDLKRILIMFDHGHTSKASIQDFSKQINSIDKAELKLEYEIKLVAKEEEWMQTIKSAKSAGFGAIFLSTHHTIVDKKGKHVPSEKLLRWTNKNTEVPLFAFWNVTVGKGRATGGVLLDGYEQGAAAARLLINIMSPQDTTVSTEQTQKIQYSRSELKRWNIKLPLSLEKKATFVD